MSAPVNISVDTDISAVDAILETVGNGNDKADSVVCTAEFTKLLSGFIKSATGLKLSESARRASKPETRSPISFSL